MISTFFIRPEPHGLRGITRQAFQPFGVRQLLLEILDRLEREVLLELLAGSDCLLAEAPIEARGLRPSPVLAVLERREVILALLIGPDRRGHRLTLRGSLVNKYTTGAAAPVVSVVGSMPSCSSEVELYAKSEQASGQHTQPLQPVRTVCGVDPLE